MSQNLAVAILKFKRDDLKQNECYRVALMNADDLDLVVNSRTPLLREKIVWQAFDAIVSTDWGTAYMRAERLHHENATEYGIHNIECFADDYWFDIVKRGNLYLLAVEGEQPDVKPKDYSLHTCGM